jgi:hypothetical protein
MTCSGPINNLEVFGGVVLGFISHVVDFPQLSVAVRLCPNIKEHTIFVF